MAVDAEHLGSNLSIIQSAKRVKYSGMNDLLDEKLLVEILCRLPCCKCVTKCKFVCKQWDELISRPFFISQFISSKLRGGSCCNIENGISKSDGTDLMDGHILAVAVRVKIHFGPTLIIHLGDSMLNPHGVSLAPLPCFESIKSEELTVVGASNDLLLYRLGGYDEVNKYDFYMCNVQTRKWLVLPSPEVLLPHRHALLQGFISEPFYSVNHSSSCKVSLNEVYQYSIVILPFTDVCASTFSAHILSSKTGGQWREVVLSLPNKCRLLFGGNLFAFKEKLHFYCFEGIVSFDPYHEVDNAAIGGIDCRVIPKPDSVSVVRGLSGAVTCVSQGQLYICDLNVHRNLDVWKLKDYETGEWSLQYRITKQEWISKDRCLRRLLKTDFLLIGSVVGFHPSYSDLVYLLGNRWILLCNLSTRVVEVACPAPQDCSGIYYAYGVFPLVLPSWPTPLPTLTQGACH